MRARVLVPTACLLLAFVAGAFWLRQEARDGAAPVPAATPSAGPAPAVAPPPSPSAPPVTLQPGLPEPAPVVDPVIDPDRYAAAHAGDDAPRELPTEIHYPRAEKLTRETLSEIPHEIVGAWDDTPDPAEIGERRAFIAVVPPELSDDELADFARDVRDRHRDALWLTLRVFDDARAATRPSWTDGGAARDAHLVAELRRSTAGEGEWLTVRGRPVDP